jgi:CubicO group peptidase (beta-lactamase class C family)
MLNRKTIYLCLLLCAPLRPSAVQITAAAGEPPITGQPVAELAAYDKVMTELLAKWNIPGAALAVGKEGRLVFARGYGWANVEDKKPVQPDSLFRIASISKPITAVAVLRLVERGRLSLDAKVVDVLNLDDPAAPGPPSGAKIDRRWHAITIRHLLQHTAGWDRAKSFDPMFIPLKAAAALGAPPPADTRTIIRYMLGQPLDFNPGERFAYSNFGYALLGRVIEARTGRDYAAAVQELVLRPAGITRMCQGRSLVRYRHSDEVRYYHCDAKDLADPVFADIKQNVPWPDGGFHLEAMDAHGGWIASAPDLVRFTAAIEGRGCNALLQPATRKQMLDEPAPPANTRKEVYCGLGWNVRPQAGDAHWFHTGSLAGTTTLLVRGCDGITYAALFNSRPKEHVQFKNEIESRLWQVCQQTHK